MKANSYLKALNEAQTRWQRAVLNAYERAQRDVSLGVPMEQFLNNIDQYFKDEVKIMDFWRLK